MQYIFLSHDVDWRRQGPPIEHVLARKDRFMYASSFSRNNISRIMVNLGNVLKSDTVGGQIRYKPPYNFLVKIS